MSLRQRYKGEALSRFSVTRPVTIGVLFAALLVLGAIAYLRIPVQLVPTGYDLPFLYVEVPTLPSTPEDVEDKVAVPVEEMLSTVKGIEQLRSRVRTNRTSFFINFEDGTDMVEAYNQVRDRLERVLPTLPDDVDRYFIWKYDPNDSPIYWFGVSLAGEGPDGDRVQDHYDLLYQEVVRPIERIDGVSRVEMWGAQKRMIRVEIDDDRAAAAGLTTYDLIQKLRRDNFTVSAGNIDAHGQRESVRVIARFDDLDEIRKLPIGNNYRLEDVAEVTADFEETTEANRINGDDAVLFGVFKEADANAVDVCNAIRATLEDRFHGDNAQLTAFEFHDFQNQGDLILGAIQNLQETALFGGLFAIVILFVFIRRVRMTLIIAVAIPVSMLVTVVVMYFTNFTLNLLTLMGLMLSVGMVVDNSIVVVENIQRRRYGGEDPLQAAIKGTAEVALALLVATLTTVIVFLPMILMTGNESLSFYLGKIGYPICISLVASLFVSLLFIPVASAFVLGSNPKPEKPLRMMLFLERVYRRMLSWVVRRKYDAAVLFVAIAATVYIPIQGVERTDELDGKLNDVRVRFNFPRSMTDEERDAYFREAEAALEGIREEIFITSYLTRMSRRRIRVFLDQDREDAPSREFIAQRIEEVMPVRPGVNVRVGWGRSRRGGGGDSESSITLKLRGPDSRKLAELSEEVVRRIKTLDHVTGVEAELEEEARDELHFIIQREAAQRQGLPATLIGGSIDYTLRGRRLSDVRLGGRDLEMRAIGNDAAGEDLSVLQVVRMPAQGGNNTATLAQVTEVRVEKGYGDINRENRETVLGVEVTTDEDDLEALAASIDGVLDGFEMPRGYYLGKGDRLKQLKESENDQIFALTLAIVFVFLLMGVLFESASIPFAIVFSIPFAFLGTFWILYLTNTPFDIMAGVGLIILVGIVVNNAIVLIDTVQQRRDRLMRESAKNGDVSPETARAHLYDAVIEGSVRRLRPVLMTALTTIFGLIPMAAGDSGIVGIPYAPLGRSVIGGLLASTLLTLFVVPFLYVLLAHVRAAAGRASARIGWRKPVAPASEPPAA